MNRISGLMIRKNIENDKIDKKAPFGSFFDSLFKMFMVNLVYG